MSSDPFRLDTPRLCLIASRLSHLQAELESSERLGALLGVEVPASWPPGEYDRDSIAYFCARYEAEGAAAVGAYGWYAILPGREGAPAQLVAAGGYFGPPAEDGTVEIGYSVVPEARRRGYATELARALTERALGLPGVTRVVAHAADDNVGSHRVLERAGFRAVGPAAEPGKQRFERVAGVPA